MKRNLFAKPSAPHEFKVGDKAYVVEQFDIDEHDTPKLKWLKKPRVLRHVGGVTMPVVKVTQKRNGAWVTIDTGEGLSIYKLGANNEYHIGDERFGFYLRPATGPLAPR